MLKINIIAIGKIKEKYFKDAISEYQKRLQNTVNLSIIELEECLLSGSNNIETVKDNESNKLLSEIKGYSILLDIEGRALNSLEFSGTFNKLMTEGNNEISFLIGGSYGVNEKLKNAVNMRLTFGKMTYPHQLMRVILIEQIYRAFSIMNHSQYHK